MSNQQQQYAIGVVGVHTHVGGDPSDDSLEVCFSAT